MKVFVILALIVASFQAGSSAPTATEVAHQINAALGKCVVQLNLNKDEIITLIKQDVAPEENDNFTAFIACFAKDLKVTNNAGDVDFENFLPVIQNLITQGLGDFEGVDAKAHQIASGAVEQCKSTPKTEQPGLTEIRIRNCAIDFSKKAQNH